jgi:hypothetical protein
MTKKSFVLISLVALLATASAQQPSSAPGPSPTQPSSAPSSPPQSAPVTSFVAPATIPNNITVNLTGLPKPGGPGWIGSVVIAAILTGIASLIAAVINTNLKAEKDAELQNARQQFEKALASERLQHEKDLQNLKLGHEKALADKREEYESARKILDLESQQSHQEASLTREDRRIDIERARLGQMDGASQIEIEVEAIKLAREHGMQCATLIHTFFEKLTSSDNTHRELALMAIASFVDTQDLETFLQKKFEPPKSPSPGTDIALPPVDRT